MSMYRRNSLIISRFTASPNALKFSYEYLINPYEPVSLSETAKCLRLFPDGGTLDVHVAQVVDERIADGHPEFLRHEFDIIFRCRVVKVH